MQPLRGSLSMVFLNWNSTMSQKGRRGELRFQIGFGREEEKIIFDIWNNIRNEVLLALSGEDYG